MGHLELGEVGLEGHLGVVGLAGVDAGLARHDHVVLPCLEEWRRSNHGNKSVGLLIEYSQSINMKCRHIPYFRNQTPRQLFISSHDFPWPLFEGGH